jgi:hypothetical protein
MTDHEISSACLKDFDHVQVSDQLNLFIVALNLVRKLCISRITQAPSFENMGSLVTSTIIFDGYAFSDDFEDFNKDEPGGTTDEDDNNKKYKTGMDLVSP